MPKRKSIAKTTYYDELPKTVIRPGKSPIALRVRLDDGSGFDLTEAGTKKSLAVYVVRDPRDVVISLAHHLGSTPEHAVGFMGDPRATFAPSTARLDPQLAQRLGTWSQHVTGWLDHDLFDVLLVRYEDLQADAAGQLRRIVDFGGLEATDEQVAPAYAALSTDEQDELPQLLRAAAAAARRAV